MNKYEIRAVPKKDAQGITYWTAFYPAIKECVGGGATMEEAIKEAEENLSFYLEFLESEKISLPAEYEENVCCGKIALRISKTTHKKLLEIADDEGISLNLLINNAIENYIGQQDCYSKIETAIKDLQQAYADSSEYLKNVTIQSLGMNYELWKQSVGYTTGDRYGN